MSLLILHRNPLEPFPFDAWLHDYQGEVVILAARDRIERAGEQLPPADAGYARIELLDDFEDAAVLRERAVKLAVEHRVRHVVAHFEGDVAHAAWLRERLGLAGAWSADVRPFRDKALMKRRLTQAGVEVARHTVPAAAEDALEFAQRVGFPVVCKDRAGFNAIGLRILRDGDELESHTRQVFGGACRDDLLVEEYVPGRMCHVDGLALDGRLVAAWPSQYQYDLASYGADHGARVDLTLDADDPLTDRLLALTERSVAALRPPESRLRDHAVHAEIFHTPDDRLVVCEVACRAGGAKLREVFQVLFGVNLGACATRAELGLPIAEFEGAARGGERPRPARMSGQVLMMKRPGRVLALPEPPPQPWVERFWRHAQVGQTIPPAAGSADFLLAAVASAPTRAECEQRLRALGAQFEAQTEIAALP